MFNRTKISMGVMLALGSMLATTQAVAQETQRVEITGSSIKRVATEGALPVQVISQDQIKRSGATSVTDLMQSLPVMQGFTSIGDSVGGGGGGITTASLHDVGEQYTLVLLNGRRVAPATSGTTIDLNSIPLSAIERVEILTDGASALYGADAIAGVINFILKRGQAPLELDAKFSKPEHAGGEQFNFSISKGFGDLYADGYSLFISGSYDKSKQLKAAQREFAKTGLLSGTVDANTAYDLFNGSSRSVPPNVDVRGTNIGLASGGTRGTTKSFSPYLAANGNCPANHVALGTQCYFDYTSTVEIAPERERKGIYASGKLALGKSDWNLFGDLAYTQVDTIARIAPYPAEFSLPVGGALYNTYIAPNLAAGSNVTSVNVKYRLYDLGNRAYDYGAKSLHAVAGAEGRLGPWDMSTAFTYSKQKQPQDYLGGFPLAAPFTAALSAGTIDPFPYTVGTMPAAMLAALRATGYVGNYNTTDIKMTAWEGNAQRPLFAMGGGDAVVSFGADARKYVYTVTANQAVAHSEILFDDDQPEYDLSRTSWGAYSELLLPVSKDIDLTAAARYDSISGVTDSRNNAKMGGTETAGTFKLGAKWRANKDHVLRASYGTGFRVASMLEVARPKTDFGVTSGSYVCPFSASYDPLGYAAAGYVCPTTKLQFEMFQGGNTQLKPEKSDQWNLGWVWQATDTTSLSLNYWSVNIKDAVSSVSESLIFANPAQYLSLYTTKFKASNNLTYVAILDAATNIGKVENQGIDWDLSYKGKTSYGKLEGMIAGTYLVKSRYTIPGTTEFTSSLGKFGVNDAVSFRNIITAQGTVGVGAWEHTATMKYRSGYTDQAYSEDDCVFYNPISGDCKAGALTVPEYMTFDWRTVYKATKNLTLALGVENIFDEAPPLSLRINGAGHQLGYDPRYASPYGRTYTLNMNYKF